MSPSKLLEGEVDEDADKGGKKEEGE